MNFIVKQKIFSFADSFNIVDENDVPHYKVQGKFFSMGKKLNIYDMEENHLIYIEQKLFKFLPEYLLYEGDDIVARVKSEFTFFRPKVNIESVYGDFTIEGSVLRYDFLVKKDGVIIADISKAFIALSDTYSVSIDDIDNNKDFILALVIVIDQIFHDNRNKNSS